MEFLADLWLPIVLNGIALFIASSIAWTVLPHHFSDWKKVDQEDNLIDTVDSMNLPAGAYMFPFAADQKAQTSKEFQERYAKGPRGILMVWNTPNMGANLGLTFLFFLVTSAIVGYVTHIACPPEAVESTFMKVFRVAGTIGILSHGSSGILNGIWFRRPLLTNVIDGIAYGLILGLIFAFCWPAAV